MRRVLAAYRRTGADPPFADPRAWHGAAMEGYFWRLTDPGGGTVVLALLGVNRDATGRCWGTVALAAHPGGVVRTAAVPEAWASGDGLAVRAGPADAPVFAADEERLRVDLGPGARLDIELGERVGWPRRAFGALGPAQLVPGLSQYWHPHLLGGRATGTATLGGREVVLDGAGAYAEKNWSAGGGFPTAWFWGQAHDFPDADCCVAFAGGGAAVGPLRLRAAALALRLEDRLLTAVRPPQPIAVETGAGVWRLRARGPGRTIEVEGEAAGVAPHPLPVPVPEERRNLVGASRLVPAGRLRVAVRRRGRTVFEGTSPLAGLELGSSRPERAEGTEPVAERAPVAVPA